VPAEGPRAGEEPVSKNPHILPRAKNVPGLTIVSRMQINLTYVLAW
jgi:hypothetical protein